ncbi:MAG: hypothetical protein ACUVTX_11055 [Bacteroidales bacterium]
MTKRIIFIIFILLAGLAVLFYYIQQGSRNILTDPYKAIPADASFFIESSNLSGLLNSIAENNGLFREIVNIKGMEDFVRKFNSFRTFFNRNEITAISENQTAVISFHLTNNKKLMPLLVMTVPKHIRFRHLSGLLKTLAGTRQKTIRKEINRRIELTWDNSDREVKLCFGFISGLVICSPSSELFYRAIAQKDEGNNIRNAFGLSKIITSSGKKEDKIFIIFKNLKGVADGFIRDNNSGLADKITQLAGSAEADIFISENGYLLNGYTEAADSSDILYRFKSYKASNLSTYRRLPANSVLFETIIISDKTLEEPEGVTEASGIYEFDSELLPALDNEITRSVVDLRKTEEGKGNLIIYRLKNRDLAERIVTE